MQPADKRIALVSDLNTVNGRVDDIEASGVGDVGEAVNTAISEGGAAVSSLKSTILAGTGRRSLLDFGADPTGVNYVDDALQAGFDWLDGSEGRTLYAPAGDYKISRKPDGEPNQTYGAVIFQGTLEGDGPATHFFLDPNSTNPSRYYPIRIGTNTEATRGRIVFRDFKLTSNNSVIGEKSVMGLANRHDDWDTVSNHSDDVTVTGCYIMDSAVAVGCTKHTGPEGAEPGRQLTRHKNWRVINNVIVKTSNKAVEFGQLNGGWIIGNDIQDCFDGPQAIFYSSNVWMQNNRVRYRDTGINIAQGTQDFWIIDNDVKCRPDASPGASCPALVFRTEPNAGSLPVLSNGIVRGNKFSNTQTNTARRVFQLGTRDEVIAAVYENVAFESNRWDGDIVLHSFGGASKTTVRGFRFTDDRINGNLVTVKRSVCDVSAISLVRTKISGSAIINGSDFDMESNAFEGGLLLGAGSSGNTSYRDKTPTGAVTDNGSQNTVTAPRVGGAEPPAAPGSLPGVVAAFDADTLTAGAFTTWAPTAGTKTAPLTHVGDNAPTVENAGIGTHKAVKLVAAESQRLTTGVWEGAASNTAFTYVLVCQPLSTGAPGNYMAGQVNALEPLVSTIASGEVGIRANGTKAQITAGTTRKVATGTPIIIVATVSGTTATIYKDSLTGVSGTVESGADITGLRLGSSGSGNGPFGDLKVGYAAVFGRALTDTEAKQITVWASSRFGITIQ